MRRRRQLEGTHRARATTRTTLGVPHLPLPHQVYIPVYSLAAQPPCVHLPQCCQHYPHLSAALIADPHTWDQFERIQPRRPALRRGHTSSSSPPHHQKVLSQGAEIIRTPSCPTEGNYPHPREVRCLFMSFDFFICGGPVRVSNWQRTAARPGRQIGFLLRAKATDLLWRRFFLSESGKRRFLAIVLRLQIWKLQGGVVVSHRFFCFPTTIIRLHTPCLVMVINLMITISNLNLRTLCLGSVFFRFSRAYTIFFHYFTLWDDQKRFSFEST